MNLSEIQNIETGIFTKEWVQSQENRFKLKLVHGTKIEFATEENEGFAEADGVWTREFNLWIGISWADCVPIVLARKDAQAVGAIHAGWRGTRQRIAQHFCDSIQSQGEDPKEWSAWIGPSIRSCCFQVSPDLFADFQDTFGTNHAAFPKENFIDLALINAEILKLNGIENVEIASPCTCCTQIDGKYAFHSYRRDKTTVRQYSMIRRTP